VFVLDSNQKGVTAELKVAAAAASLGLGVYQPLSGHSRADLVFEVADQLLRVQCKWGRLTAAGDAILVHVGSSRRCQGGYRRTTYGAEEIDLFGVYCGELDRCLLIPAELAAGKHGLQLRLTPARNNQRSCINLADDFDFPGAIAQLEERLHGMQEVAGSSPASSTSPDDDLPLAVQADRFRVQMGTWLDRVRDGQRLVITRRGRRIARLEPA
jgi:prevent-host-death family protein